MNQYFDTKESYEPGWWLTVRWWTVGKHHRHTSSNASPWRAACSYRWDGIKTSAYIVVVVRTCNLTLC